MAKSYQSDNDKHMTKFYAEIGSRQTPDHVLATMEAIGDALGRRGWILQSGGAPGADAAFECGCDRTGGTKQILLPWSGYCGHVSQLHEVTPAMLDLASRYHPHWRKLSHKARLLIARSGAQILGANLTSPVAWIVC